ncbi:hypothetical protein EDD22DRAFT_947745 [Suillus occidentalis]|nr:hypothetical protein EDD22DRAFT_947745 [Suillus occidentalis]
MSYHLFTSFTNSLRLAHRNATFSKDLDAIRLERDNAQVEVQSLESRIKELIDTSSYRPAPRRIHRESSRHYCHYPTHLEHSSRTRTPRLDTQQQTTPPTQPFHGLEYKQIITISV